VGPPTDEFRRVTGRIAQLGIKTTADPSRRLKRKWWRQAVSIRIRTTPELVHAGVFAILPKHGRY